MRKYSESSKWQTIPENTGLDVIHDNRTGDKLEIVIPVFNEEKRIGNILSYYKEFDIVLMDGGSTDRTIEMAIKSGATVYRRVGEPIGENHFVYYVNKITKSGYCFYMMADHFIKKSYLKEAYLNLQNENSVVFVRVIEWFYGEDPKMNLSKNYGLARGFRRGSATFDPYKFHDSLHYKTDHNSPKKIFVYDLHHLHIRSIKNEYGKIGRYLDAEINQLINKKASFYQYFRRFVVPVMLFIFLRAWFNKTSLHRKVLKLMELTISAQIAVMCWIEQKYMPSVEDQIAEYSSKYCEKANKIAKSNDAISFTEGNL